MFEEAGKVTLLNRIATNQAVSYTRPCNTLFLLTLGIIMKDIATKVATNEICEKKLGDHLLRPQLTAASRRRRHRRQGCRPL